MAATTMPRIERTEIDGVPVLWSEAPGPVTAALQFRVGRTDERPPVAGITHLVEHLSMAPLGQPRYEHNAFVESVRTVYFATGAARDLIGFFETVGTALLGLSMERLAMERDVLKRESAGRGDSVVDVHRNLRFGLSPHGMAAQQEFGLGTVGPERIAAWAADAFGQQNAMAWMTGPPPNGFRFPLPEGGRLELPPVEPIADVRWPVHLAPDSPGVGIGFLLSRKRGAGTFIALLHRRLRQRLRLERGLVYDVLADYEPLDSEQAIAIVGAECTPDQNEQVVEVMLAELDALERGGATDEELADELADLEGGLSDQTSVTGLLDQMVADALLGMPERSPEERYEEQRTTSAADVAVRAAEARSSALLLADIDGHPAGFEAYPATSSQALAGREVKPFLSVFGIGPKVRLTIGPEGLTIRGKDGSLATVRYDSCVMLERPEDDVLVMWSRDGSRVFVPAAFWRGGEQIIAEVERALPAELLVRDRISLDLLD